jgi:HK97 family phage prohead protease
MAARYDHIDFTPPAGVRDEAAKGLAWRSEYGRGGTAVGIARARDLSNGATISPETARRMKAYFDRHEIDKQGKGWNPGENGFPSNGRIAWALWGSDPGRAWSRKLVEQMNAADEENRSMVNAIERRSLILDEVESDTPLLAVETRSEEGESESREWIVGYAAKFNTLSLDLGDFVERLDPGAFGLVTERRGRKKPLQTRALWNHDANFPLARYPETLRLTVDDIGLRYEFPVPDTTYGRDIAANIRAGIVKGSSFAFQVAKGGDEWSVEEGRSVRTIKAVDSLIDVSPTTFPAYPDSDVAVAKRSFDQFRQTREAEVERRAASLAKRATFRKQASKLREYLGKHGR